MINLYRSNMSRFLKNIYFIGGCIIAFTVTLAVASGSFVFPFLTGASPSMRTFFVSAAMVVYFTVFIPVYTSAEYSDGVIRNKIIAGFSQTQIICSLYLSYISLALIMWACYIAGGMLGGAAPFGDFASANLAILVALMSFIAILMVLSFRLKKTVSVVIAAGVLFTVSFNMVLFGNLILMLLSDSGNGAAAYVASLVYNVNVLGQWFSLTGLADDVANPGIAAQLLISLCCIIAALLIGNLGLNKRDIV